MEDDRQMKIWSRVRGGPENRAGELQPLLAMALGEAAVFGALLRQLPGETQGTLRLLRTEELEHARCIRGIGLLSGIGPMKAGVAPAKQERPEAALRRSYGNALRAMREYGDRAGDPEYGPVFQWMQQRERAHCAVIAKLMGTLGA